MHCFPIRILLCAVALCAVSACEQPAEESAPAAPTAESAPPLPSPAPQRSPPAADAEAQMPPLAQSAPPAMESAERPGAPSYGSTRPYYPPEYELQQQQQQAEVRRYEYEQARRMEERMQASQARRSANEANRYSFEEEAAESVEAYPETAESAREEGGYGRGARSASSAGGANHAVVEVFYATDRDRTGDSQPSRFYGGDRGELRYGICRVSIPREHRLGALEAPSVWRLEFRENPDKHVVLLELQEHDRETYLSNLAARVRASSGKSALLFVHGYNVTFEDAARRTAQLHYDLGFDGASVFYSWPSRGEVAAYPVDETNVQWTHVHLVEFLEHFVEHSEAEHIYVIAHSMGNRAVTRAVSAYLSGHAEAAPRFREIILTAPDIDSDVFRREIAPTLANFGAPITLYASSRDKALLASKKFHGYPRAGDAGNSLIVMSGVETIDASATDTSFLGHSYYGDTRSVLSDLYYLVREGKRPPQRFSLQVVETDQGAYWVFKP